MNGGVLALKAVSAALALTMALGACARASNAIVDKPSGLQGIKFTLLSSPHVSREAGIPDPAGGGVFWGRDWYSYDGYIAYLDKKTRYRSGDSQRMPIAMCEYKGDYYMLGGAAFHGSETTPFDWFTWYRDSGAGQFEPVSMALLEPAFRDVSLTNKVLNCAYKLWVLEELAESQGIGVATEYFNRFAQEDPRFLHIANEKGGGPLMLVRFL